MQECGNVANFRHLLAIVRHIENGLSRSAELADAPETLVDKTRITNRQCLIDDKDIGVDVHSGRKSDTRIHAGRVGSHRLLKKLAYIRKHLDIAHARFHLAPAEAHQRPIHHDVFAPGEVRVEPGSEFEQRGNLAVDLQLALGGLQNRADDLQQS